MTRVTQNRLQELPHYDCHSGVFTWIKAGRRGSTVKAGDVAGYRQADGYVRICVDGRYYKRHLLAWLYVYGQFPSMKLDHRDGVAGNDWIKNLRLANNAENSYNRKAASKTGYKGVCFKRGRFEATIGPRGKKYLGSFVTAEEAAKAYDTAAKAIYGEFARLNFIQEPNL